MGICENCKSKINKPYASGRFCSVKCSKTFSSKRKKNKLRLSQEEAEFKTLKLCGNRGIKLIGKYETSNTKCLFFQNQYGEFYARPSNVWRKTNHPEYGKNNRIKTCIKKYGTKNNFLSKDEDGILKRIKTNIQKFGYENNSQNPNIIKKIQKHQKETMLKKYGVEYAAQNDEFFEKMVKSGFSSKIFNSEKFGEIMYQSSYELNFIKECELNKDIIKLKRGPKIKYLNPLDNKIHYYYTDFIIQYLTTKSKIFEIKSEYTFGDNSNKFQEKKMIINLAKIDGVKKYYDETKIPYELRVYSKNKTIIKLIKI